MTRTIPSVEVREVGKGDLESVARLAGELGYPTTTAQICERLKATKEDGGHVLFVAVDGRGGVAGWIELSEERSLLSEPRAEITGLVVDTIYRGAGVGQALVERGEGWARQRGLTALGVRSNTLRERAHQFYLRLGYTIIKSQRVVYKAL